MDKFRDTFWTSCPYQARYENAYNSITHPNNLCMLLSRRPQNP